VSVNGDTADHAKDCRGQQRRESVVQAFHVVQIKEAEGVQFATTLINNPLRMKPSNPTMLITL
jgi:hypothetical protein